jgi:hypothetical protein
MKAEDQYFIAEVEVFITRNGNGIVEERHLKTDEDHKYYKVSGKETRYVIYGASGIKMLPATIYTSKLKDECYFASGVIRKTNSYIRELDNTYFKFYDDAEEVLKNIILFISWLRNKPKITGVKMKKIKARTDHLLMEVHAIPEVDQIRMLQAGLKVKRRSELKPLALELQNELDLKGHDLIQ